MIRLGLSTLAAPEVDLQELFAACEQRGLTALELPGRTWVRLRSIRLQSLNGLGAGS